ncbi:hypothetical protein [Serinibacter salmoneus]|uniref:hypothetical protein n=1 Tax=Serinibacter salmoneus TaxID=556530 RepID=UPI00117B5A9D|nr:hypothetical protein [Serinibacter salmoneus]
MGDEDAELVLPPGNLAGVCPWCQGALAGKQARCVNCEENAGALGGTVEPIIPISLYAKPSPLRDWLTFYKDDGEAPADPLAREAIGTILERFFAENEAWISRLGADGLVIVPSTRRPPPHPLAVLASERIRPPLTVKSGLMRTTASLGHNKPNAQAFEVSRELHGRRIVLLEDVYTSGARAQSAAHALRCVDTQISALFVIGRRYNPGYSEQSNAVFARQKAMDFEWSAELRDVTRTLDA